MTALSVLCAALAMKARQVERQRATLAWVKDLGGGYEVEYSGHWLQGLIGDDYFATVVYVGLAGGRITNISPLSNLRKLKRLELDETSAKDLSCLTGLITLEELIVADTTIDDLSPITNLSNLRKLGLFRTDVSDEDVAWLARALPNCSIYTDRSRWPPPALETSRWSRM